MIRFEFYGSVIEGQTDLHSEEEALLEFRVQLPIRDGEVPFNPPTLNGEPLDEIARVRNRAMGRDTSFTLEFEIREPGELVIESYMALTSSAPNLFRVGVKKTESGILILEAVPQPFPWFIDGDFIEAGENGARSIFIPYAGAGEPIPGGPFTGDEDLDDPDGEPLD